jgi:uncharacterized protein YaaW (UPF0174 family)
MGKYAYIYEYDEDLSPVLKKASNNDLQPLVEYILSAKTNFLDIADLYQKYSPNHVKYAELIETEIRVFGGNTFLNIFRGNGPSYHEIACDVANKLGAGYKKDWPVADVENSILLKIMSKAWEKMNDKEKSSLLNELGLKSLVGGVPKSFPFLAVQGLIKATGLVAYKIALVVANSVASFVLGRGLSIAANAALTRWMSVFAGPVGWMATGLWTAFDLSGPAYRVTVPSVVHIAMLRQKSLIKTCPNCSEPYTEGARFCHSCGGKL